METHYAWILAPPNHPLLPLFCTPSLRLNSGIQRVYHHLNVSVRCEHETCDTYVVCERNRLIRPGRFHHFLALRICEYLRIPKNHILVDWACAKVCCRFMLQVYAAGLCCRFMLLVYAAGLCCRLMLQAYAVGVCCRLMLQAYAVGVCCRLML